MVLNNLFRSDGFNSWVRSALAKGTLSLSRWSGPLWEWCLLWMSIARVIGWLGTGRHFPTGCEFGEEKPFLVHIHTHSIQRYVCEPERQAVFSLILKTGFPTHFQCFKSAIPLYQERQRNGENGGLSEMSLNCGSFTFRIMQVEKIKNLLQLGGPDSFSHSFHSTSTCKPSVDQILC